MKKTPRFPSVRQMIVESALMQLVKEENLSDKYGIGGFTGGRRHRAAARGVGDDAWKEYKREQRKQHAREFIGNLRDYKHPWEDDFYNGSRDITVGDKKYDWKKGNKQDQMNDMWNARGEIMRGAFDGDNENLEGAIEDNWDEMEYGMPPEPTEKDFEWEGEREELDRIDREDKELRKKRIEAQANSPVLFAGFEFPDRKTAKDAIRSAFGVIEYASRTEDDGWKYNTIRNTIRHSILGWDHPEVEEAEPGTELLPTMPMVVVTRNILMNDDNWMRQYGNME